MSRTASTSSDRHKPVTCTSDPERPPCAWSLPSLQAGGQIASLLAPRTGELASALGSLLAAAAAAGEVRGDVDPLELLRAVSRLCSPAGVDHAGDERMVALLIDGLRYGAKPKPQSAEH